MVFDYYVIKSHYSFRVMKPEFLNKTTLFLVYKNQSIIIFLIMLLPSFVSFTK